MLARQPEATARPEVHRPPMERATTAHSPGTGPCGEVPRPGREAARRHVDGQAPPSLCRDALYGEAQAGVHIRVPVQVGKALLLER